MRPPGRVFLLALLSVVISAPATAQNNYPARPITFVVPLQAGTASDLVARILSEKVGAKIGQPIVVENAPGAEELQSWLKAEASRVQTLVERVGLQKN